jgi:hypothetical protein
MEFKTLLITVSFVNAFYSIFMLAEFFGIMKLSNDSHNLLSGCYIGSAFMGFLLLGISKIQARSKAKETREIL